MTTSTLIGFAKFIALLAVAATCAAPSAAGISKADEFKSELATAKSAPTRESRIRHFRRALSLRPNDPANIVLEFNIGIELTQREYPPEQREKNLAEGLATFERIAKTYKHMDYYSSDPNDGEDSQMMVPAAALLAAQLDWSKTRERLLFAMECFDKTFKKRVEDWKVPHVEPDMSAFIDGPKEVSKRKSREAFYKKRQAAAAKGDVFGPTEMVWVELAVRRYSRTHGLEARSPVPAAEIAKKFPGTPMAKLAREQLESAKKAERSRSGEPAIKEADEDAP